MNPIIIPKMNSKRYRKNKFKKQPTTLKKEIIRASLKMVRYIVWSKLLKFQEYSKITIG
jgi:hypothetical protein